MDDVDDATDASGAMFISGDNPDREGERDWGSELVKSMTQLIRLKVIH